MLSHYTPYRDTASPDAPNPRMYGCIGDVGETWFQRNGSVYQLSVAAADRELQDAWLRDIAEHLTFPN